MKKILLINDDFNELVHVESQFKKVGLDVVGLSNEHSLSEQVLGFNPDLVIASGQTQRVSAMSVSRKMAQNRNFHGKVILIVAKGMRPKPDELVKMKMDALVEAPVSMERLLQVSCKILGLEYSSFLEKLQRVQAQEESKGQEPNAETQEKIARAKIVRGMMADGSLNNSRRNPAPSPNARYADTQRMAKYAEFLANEKPINTKETTFSRDDIRARQKELKKDWDFKELEDLDNLKRDFANALFRKK